MAPARRLYKQPDLFAVCCGVAAHIDPCLIAGRLVMRDLTKVQRRIALDAFVQTAAHRPSLFAFSRECVVHHEARVSFRDASPLPYLVKDREYVPAPREMHDFLDTCDSTSSTDRYILSRLRDAMPVMDVEVSTSTWRKALVIGRQTLLRMFSVLPNMGNFEDLDSHINKALMIPAWDALLASPDQIRIGTVRIVADAIPTSDYTNVFNSARLAGHVDPIAAQIFTAFCRVVCDAPSWFLTTRADTRIDLLEMRLDVMNSVVRKLELPTAGADVAAAMHEEDVAYMTRMRCSYPSVPDDLRKAVLHATNTEEVKAAFAPFFAASDALHTAYHTAALRSQKLVRLLRGIQSPPPLSPPESFAVFCTRCDEVCDWTLTCDESNEINETLRCDCECGRELVFDRLPPAAMYCGDVNPDARGVLPDAMTRKKEKKEKKEPAEAVDIAPMSPPARATIACVTPSPPAQRPTSMPTIRIACGPHAIVTCSKGCGAEFSKESWKGVAGGIDWRNHIDVTRMACLCTEGCDGRLALVTVRGREVFAAGLEESDRSESEESEELDSVLDLQETQEVPDETQEVPDETLPDLPDLPDLMDLMRLEPRAKTEQTEQKKKKKNKVRPNKNKAKACVMVWGGGAAGTAAPETLPYRRDTGAYDV